MSMLLKFMERLKLDIQIGYPFLLFYTNIEG
jgi:hypothetical protein